DPPDGRIPAWTSAGQQRRAALARATNFEMTPAGPRDLTTFQRCLTWGVPMLRPGPYTSYYQIVQAGDYLLIVMEAAHGTRIVPLDGRPHMAKGLYAWDGDSVGRWDGNTLVVDTTNFSPQDNFMGSAENLHLIERFTRVAPDEIRYEV